MSPREASTKPPNPWLTKGSSQLFSRGSLKSPVHSAPQVHPHSIDEDGKQSYSDYFIQSSGKSSVSLEECLTETKAIMEDIEKDMNAICMQNEKTTDSSVFEGYETVGFMNEGNYCYQNSVLQVSVLFGVHGSAYFIIPHSSCY